MTTYTKLSDKAMLVKLTTRRASLTKRDAYLTATLQAQENDKSLTVLTKLFKETASPVRQIMSAYNEVYQYHKTNTLPYVDGGPRLLPSERYMDYTQEMKHRIAKADKLLDTYIPYYDQLVVDDVNYRNSSTITGRARASTNDYPSAEEFQQSMSIDLRFQPMPNESHFLFDLSEDDLASFRRSEEDAAALANADTIQRMLKPTKALVDRLAEYRGEKGERFHNSLVENVIEGCKLARQLALSPSPELLTEIASLEEVAKGYLDTVEIIKGSPLAREQARSKLAEVASKMSMFS
jgi:hypothetical protein